MNNNTAKEGEASFNGGNIQEIDLRLPRRVSFKTDTERLAMEDTKKGDSELNHGDILLAATLINDARKCRNMSFKTDEKSVKSYLLYQRWIFKYILHICLWGNLALAIFEKPSVPGAELPYWATMIMEVVFLSYFIYRFIHHLHFDLPQKFWKDPKNITTLVIIALTFIDMLTYIFWVNLAPQASAEKAVRWSRPLRPFLLINFPEGRQIRKAFRNIRRTVPDILHVMVLFFASIAILALMAVKILQQKGLTYSDGTPYFQNYFQSYWDLYVLVTTANNPDVMMPAYDSNQWFALFFITFSILNQYIFMSIILATVYNNYKRHLKDEVRETVYMKRELLGRAFDILKVYGVGGQYVVSKSRWHDVMKEVIPNRSFTQVNLLLYVLDEDGDSNIVRKEFLQVADLLNVRLTEVQDRMTFLEKMIPGCFNSAPSMILRQIVSHKAFRFFFDFAILVNAICIGMNFEEAEWFFLAIFTLEILLKMYAHGPVKFFRSAWNTFDFFVILAAALATVVETINGQYSERGRTLDFILVLRVLRLVRLIGSIERFQIIITTIVNIGPSILTYGGVIFVVYYVYAIIGMECFQGLIKYTNHTMEPFCGNEKLNGSEFFNKGYCNNNFNDITHSFVLLFDLMVVNQWHVLTQGFVLVTHEAVRLFFISFHVVCVVLLLNIFTAFVLEVFLLEYSISGTPLEDTIDAKIKDMGLGKGMIPIGRRLPQDKVTLVDDEERVDGGGADDTAVTVSDVNITPPAGEGAVIPPPGVGGDNKLYFKLKRKSKKRLEELLQTMFQGEIEEGGEELAEKPPEKAPRTRRLTLETVDS